MSHNRFADITFEHVSAGIKHQEESKLTAPEEKVSVESHHEWKSCENRLKSKANLGEKRAQTRLSPGMSLAFQDEMVICSC